jgi:hypothetical protein
MKVVLVGLFLRTFQHASLRMLCICTFPKIIYLNLLKKEAFTSEILQKNKYPWCCTSHVPLWLQAWSWPERCLLLLWQNCSGGSEWLGPYSLISWDGYSRLPNHQWWVRTLNSNCHVMSWMLCYIKNLIFLLFTTTVDSAAGSCCVWLQSQRASRW